MITYRKANAFDLAVFVSLDKELFHTHHGLHPNTKKNFPVLLATSLLHSMKDKGSLAMQAYLQPVAWRQTF